MANFEQVDRAALFDFVREVFAQQEANAQILRQTVAQLEANTKALNEATAVIKATQRDYLATKKKSLGLRRRLRKGWRQLKTGSRCFKRKTTGLLTNSTQGPCS